MHRLHAFLIARISFRMEINGIEEVISRDIRNTNRRTAKNEINYHFCTFIKTQSSYITRNYLRTRTLFDPFLTAISHSEVSFSDMNVHY